MKRVLLLAAAALASACSSPRKPTFEIRQDAAKTYYDSGDLVRAAGMARQALEIEPNDVKTLSILGMSLARMGASTTNAREVVAALNEAIAVFEKAEANGGRDNFAVCFGHGTARTQRARMFLLRAEATEKAVADAADPAKRKNVDLLATPEQIENDLEKARRDAVKDREVARADLEVAEDRLLRTYELNRTYLETMEHLQVLYMLRSDYEKGIEWGERAMQQIAADRDATNLLLKRPNLTPEGLNLLRDNVRRYDTKEANGRSLLALAYQRTGRHSESLLDLDRVLTLDPERVEDYYNRGLARQAVQDYTGAVLDFEVFLRRSTQPADSPIIRETWDRIGACRQEAAARAATKSQRND